jgi:hypothetical protein
MAAPPAAFLLWLLAVTSAYVFSAHVLKKRYLRHHQAWL